MADQVQRVDDAFKDYEVIFNEAVSGLSRGSPVQYNGIKVGDVAQPAPGPEGPAPYWPVCA